MPSTFCLKIKKSNAQKAHFFLSSNNLLDGSFIAGHKGEFVFFPIKKGKEGNARNFGKVEKFILIKRQETQRKKIALPFEIIGSIALLEVRGGEGKKAKEAAKEILKTHAGVKTIAKKAAGTGGKYRIRPIKIIAGKKISKTVCKESGCGFAIDLNKAYYTPRLSHERLRIASQVKKGENILALFSGVCPYPIVIEKHSSPAKIIAIELNPQAHKMALENIKLNKCKKIIAIKADVKKELKKKKYKNRASRIIMPHPSVALEFFPCALEAAKSGCTIHLYSFCGTGDKEYKKIFENAKKIASKKGISLRLLRWRVARPYSSAQQQIVLDIKVKK
ncbi:hypothetical protein COU37_03135 [Candidatus Micrarchaeota archaeon CG10_big_fil_rev_8_21_14_0_10_45_29]|nr:MAG: hypothetical protein COU37_03135 [Candidatus Micrarchaeota archaeon CG10_big_fil_rev_8_21_14_0_10_45_29]QBM01572.1 hypothetical protein [uncultured archaeon]